MKYVLVKAVVESFWFLENSASSHIDDDAAVAQMEALSAILNELSARDKEEFVRYVREIAMEDENARGSSERVEFLKSLPDNIGLVE